MRFEPIGEGFVSRRDPASVTAVAAGPRCALGPDGEILCTFMVQSRLAVNDFVPLLARSRDAGMTWEEPQPIWPELRDRYSLFCSISRARSGELFLYGIRIPIDTPGESFWSEATQGLKQNELFWSSSPDGLRWTEPCPIPMPIAGSAEAPGPMSITSAGRWVVCYAPYPNFDPAVSVDRGQIVCLHSDDRGRSWNHSRMLQFREPHSGGAEAWVIELADGRLLGTCWHMDLQTGKDHENAYALSKDGGSTWSPTYRTGTQGQSTALAPLPDGRALFIYNRRTPDETGVRLAVVRPSESGFGLESDQLIWCAQAATQAGGNLDHGNWTDFAFGEPSVTALQDDTLLVTLWCVQPDGQ